MGRAAADAGPSAAGLAVASMIRFTWLQFRTQAVGGLRRARRSLAIVLAITGPHLVHLYDATVAPCAGRTATARRRRPAFLQNDRTLQVCARRPRRRGARASSGSSGGAAHRPRARDRHLPPRVDPERHPEPLAALKLGVVGLASMAVAGLLSLMVDVVVEPARPGPA